MPLFHRSRTISGVRLHSSRLHVIPHSLSVFFGRPLLLSPSTPMLRAFLIGSPSCLLPCSYQRNFRSSITRSIFSLLNFSFSYSLLIPSILLTPHIHLTIFLSVLNNLFTSSTRQPQLADPYVIAGRTHVL